MSAHVTKSNLPYDKEIVDIVDYVNRRVPNTNRKDRKK
jgi:hypothetical protein